MNPEFRRNLWLEFNDHRLIAMPVILGAIFLLSYLLSGEIGQGTGKIATLCYAIIIFLWGTRMAAESVLQEVHNRTWDLQRMSAISAWQMAWGKLFGATSYAWYGALMCLGVYVISYGGILPFDVLLISVLLYIGSGVFAHAVCLLVSLQTNQRRGTLGRVQVMSYQFLGLICAIPPLYSGLAGYGGDGVYRMITWYGEQFSLSIFMLLALTAFMLWSLVGVFALMRVELQQHNKPWFWLCFVGFAMVYFTGIHFTPPKFAVFLAPFPGNASTVYIVAVIATYIMVFSEPKDQVQFHRLNQFMQTGKWAQAFSQAPRSILTLPIVIGAGVTVAAFSEVTLVQGFVHVIDGRVAVIASILFVIRDVAFVYFMSLGQSDGRGGNQGDGRALLYLVLLYTVVPSLLAALHLKPLVAFFWPQYGPAPLLTLLPILIEVVVMFYLLRRRVRTQADRLAPQKFS